MFYHVDVWTYAVIIHIRWNLDAHFDNYVQKFREVVERVRDHMYTDDLVPVGESINEVQKLKQTPSSYSSETILETNNQCVVVAI